MLTKSGLKLYFQNHYLHQQHLSAHILNSKMSRATPTKKWLWLSAALAAETFRLLHCNSNSNCPLHALCLHKHTLCETVHRRSVADAFACTSACAFARVNARGTVCLCAFSRIYLSHTCCSHDQWWC